MHTSTEIAAADFTYCRADGSPLTFENVFPDYHPQDRVAVVSPHAEDGVAGAAIVVLALTTAFYDRLRATGRDFFDYPQHFCILDWNADGVMTPAGRRPFDEQREGAAWGNLDVWPECKWLRAGPTPTDMLATVFNHQINRVFWPDGFFEPADLPDYVGQILRTGIKSIHLYNAAEKSIRVSASPAGRKIIAQSLGYFQRDTPAELDENLHPIPTDQWLQRLHL